MDSEAHIIKKKHVFDDEPHRCMWCHRTYHETIPAFFNADFCSTECMDRYQEKVYDDQIKYSEQGRRRDAFESSGMMRYGKY